MKTNKLLNVLLMSGCLISCSDEGEPKDEEMRPVTNAPDSSVVDARLSSDAAGLEIEQCGTEEAERVMHSCSFAGPESGAESCELVRDGMDLCCCWAPEVC